MSDPLYRSTIDRLRRWCDADRPDRFVLTPLEQEPTVQTLANTYLFIYDLDEVTVGSETYEFIF